MGELEGVKGAWGYPEGGMGAVTEALARSAASKGADIFLNTVRQNLFLIKKNILPALIQLTNASTLTTIDLRISSLSL